MDDEDIDDSDGVDNDEVIEALDEDETKKMLAEIVDVLDGQEWDSETVEAIAKILTDRGIAIREP